MKASPSAAGFALLELLVAVLLFGIGAVAVMEAFGAAIRSADVATEILQTDVFLREKASELCDPGKHYYDSALGGSEGSFPDAEGVYRWRVESAAMNEGTDVRVCSIAVKREGAYAPHALVLWCLRPPRQ
jgi:prepilin-type N-terminal cleavage/methylation domain-containing protein